MQVVALTNVLLRVMGIIGSNKRYAVAKTLKHAKRRSTMKSARREL